MAHSDGSRNFRGHNHAGGWTYWKNRDQLRDQDPDMIQLKTYQMEELFYTLSAPCGAYNDTMQHFNFNIRPILEKGLKELYEEAENHKQLQPGKKRKF